MGPPVWHLGFIGALDLMAASDESSRPHVGKLRNEACRLRRTSRWFRDSVSRPRSRGLCLPGAFPLRG